MGGTDAVVVPPVVHFRMLSLLWGLVSPGALFLLFRDREWIDAPGLAAGFRAVRLEQWVAVALLAMHVRFLWRWWRATRVAATGTRLPDA